MTEAARFANRSERSPQPRTAAGRKLLADFRSRRARDVKDYPVHWIDEDDILAIEAESQQRGSLRSDNGLDVERLRDAMERAINNSDDAEAIAAEYARLAPQPSIEPERFIDLPATRGDGTVVYEPERAVSTEASAEPPADPPDHTGVPIVEHHYGVCSECGKYVHGIVASPPAESDLRSLEAGQSYPNPSFEKHRRSYDR